MGLQFATGVDQEGDKVCLLLKPDQDSINYCEWVEIANLMGWEMPIQEVQVSEEIPWKVRT